MKYIVTDVKAFRKVLEGISKRIGQQSQFRWQGAYIFRLPPGKKCAVPELDVVFDTDAHCFINIPVMDNLGFGAVQEMNITPSMEPGPFTVDMVKFGSEFIQWEHVYMLRHEDLVIMGCIRIEA